MRCALLLPTTYSLVMVQDESKNFFFLSKVINISIKCSGVLKSNIDPLRIGCYNDNVP